MRCINPNQPLNDYPKVSPINLPEFRASIKDGYAVKYGSKGIKKVIGYISAGDPVNSVQFKNDECFKINTGAPVPEFADAIVQIEDTKLIEIDLSTGIEVKIEVLVETSKGLDIREIGSDIRKGEILIEHNDPITEAERSVLASVGVVSDVKMHKLKIAIISTGSELISPPNVLKPGKIFDSNSIMLKLLVEKFGFEVFILDCVDDSYEKLRKSIEHCKLNCDVIICSGGVSMGDKDYVKSVVANLGYDIKFGRINMKPGKPMTYGYDTELKKRFFGLPGNPVSAFVTFHLFVLPCLKYMVGWRLPKCSLPKVNVKVRVIFKI